MKARELVFAPEARDDLSQLYELIAANASRAIALSYIERIERYCAGFDVGSERGQARSDIRPGLRTVGFEGRVNIAFASSEDRVTILRLFYGGQNWAETL